MATDVNKYFLGKFKNCANCIHSNECKLKKKHNAFNCGQFKRDFKAFLDHVKENEAKRLKREKNDRTFDKYLIQ